MPRDDDGGDHISEEEGSDRGDMSAVAAAAAVVVGSAGVVSAKDLPEGRPREAIDAAPTPELSEQRIE